MKKAVLVVLVVSVGGISVGIGNVGRWWVLTLAVDGSIGGVGGRCYVGGIVSGICGGVGVGGVGRWWVLVLVGDSVGSIGGRCWQVLVLAMLVWPGWCHCYMVLLSRIGPVTTLQADAHSSG
jgi:hypothetical protein